ncbi:MAG: heme ABC exporter ATP-binding protein CcmA [Rubrivivax sp.]|nr:heme ABC exporter ATP-binding protein CcmA [Rubrivivax sp.]
MTSESRVAVDDAPPRLRASGLAVARGGRPLLAGLGLDLGPGSLVWLRGRNGRGKTSLLRVLAGLGAAEAGALRRHGAIVWVGHGAALKDDLSVDENLAFLARLHGWPADAARRQRALDALGVAVLARRPARSLSQGQRRRVALSRLALAPARALWLLDEPADALDDEGAARLSDLLGAHARAGGAALWSSHAELPPTAPAAAVLDLDASAFSPRRPTA